MTSQQAHYRFLCTFVYVYFFAQAMSISLLTLWLRSTLKLSGAETGIVFSVNAIAAMCAQPVYGYLSDKVGMRRHVLWTVAVLCMLSGPFLIHVYGPLLRHDLLAGAAAGGVFLGVTFIAGCYAVESYVDRIGRTHGFEYSRVRMWGSLGFASAALFAGGLFNVDPRIDFALASFAGLLLVAMLAVWRPPARAATVAAGPKPRLADVAALLRNPAFWRLMAFGLTVTNLYLVFDQQFASYFASQFPDQATGTALFSTLNSVQIFLEAGGLFLAPLLVRRIGATRGLLLAGAIMMFRIGGAGLATGPAWMSAMKLLSAVELPVFAVSLFRYIAHHFDQRLTSTVYMVGVSFGHALGPALLSPLAGLGYDRIGFAGTYLLLAATGTAFLAMSAFVLAPTPPEQPAGRIPPGAPAADAAHLVL